MVKGINRYIMECKLYLIDSMQAKSSGELIDTLWNVNTVSARDLHKGLEN